MVSSLGWRTFVVVRYDISSWNSKEIVLCGLTKQSTVRRNKMSIEIKNKHTGEIIHKVEADTLRGIDLSYGYFAYADLKNLDFAGALLKNINFFNADLSGAILKDADVSYSDFSHANMSDVDLRGANMRYTTISKENINGIKFGSEVPIIEKIDAKILEAIRQECNQLDMHDWHTCGTTHCRGGWAIFLAGDAGKALEGKFGAPVAAELIYAASRPNKPIPNFYTSYAVAMADIIECAAE